jgi:hypothetical protein
MPFVLLHAGMPDDHNRDALAAWRRGLACQTSTAPSIGKPSRK